MRKLYFRPIALLLAAVCTAGCSDDVKEEGGVNVNVGDAIKFGVGGVKTRTIYDDVDGSTATSNDLQINWVNDDQILIASADAYPGYQSGTYKVTKTNDAANAGALTVVNADQYLKWGSKKEHTFYAAYPAEKATIADDGVVTFPFAMSQVCQIASSTDGVYIANPVMKEGAYMVSKATVGEDQVGDDDDVVSLTFNPIMTTLEVVVNGPTAGTDENNITPVSGIAIILNKCIIGDSFKYDIASGAIVANGSTATDDDVETINVVLTDADGNPTQIDLGPGQSIRMTAFIPPIDITTTKVQVRVQNTRSNLIKTIATTDLQKITASSKGTIKLPKFPEVASNTNNWMSALSDNIYLTELSIPGSHDAATAEPQGDEGWKDLMQYIQERFGKTQSLSIHDQMLMGIRCFDLRPAQYNDVTPANLYLYHGVVRYNILFGDAMARIAEYLMDYPDEVGVVIMRHESEVGNVPGSLGISNSGLGALLYGFASLFSESQSNWATLMNTVLSAERSYTPSDGSATQTYTLRDRIVQYDPKLTLGDVRGKIVILTRDLYNGPDGNLIYDGYIAGGFDNTIQYGTKTITGAAIGTLYVQDYYSPASAADKQTAIETLLNKKKEASMATTADNILYLNHASGYLDGATTEGYQSNASSSNAYVYNTIADPAWTYSAGIIMMDFAGDATYYGDRLPQAIVNCNYKYRMKRKTN